MRAPCIHSRCQDSNGLGSCLRSCLRVAQYGHSAHSQTLLEQVHSVLKTGLQGRVNLRMLASKGQQMEQTYADTDIGGVLGKGYDQDLSRPPKNRRAGMHKPWIASFICSVMWCCMDNQYAHQGVHASLQTSQVHAACRSHSPSNVIAWTVWHWRDWGGSIPLCRLAGVCWHAGGLHCPCLCNLVGHMAVSSKKLTRAHWDRVMGAFSWLCACTDSASCITTKSKPVPQSLPVESCTRADPLDVAGPQA